MSLIDGVFDVLDDILNGDTVNFIFHKCSSALSAVSYASSINSVTIMQILLGLLVVGAVAMIYVSPHFKEFVVRIVSIIYPII